MSENAKPIPSPSDATLPFWAGCAAKALRLRHCEKCGGFTAPNRFVCNCGNARLSWKDASGTGKVFSFTVVRRAPDPAFRAEVPYVVAVIELDEGVRLLSNVVGSKPEDVRIDMTVRAVFETVGEGLGVPKFEPAP